VEIDLNEFIPGTEYFKWKEVLWCNTWGVHVFPTPKQYSNLCYTVGKLHVIRGYLDRPMRITSALRPKLYNKLIGGAANSMHMHGRAIDFVVKGMTADEVRENLYHLLEALEIRMENLPGSNWTHIDVRKPHNGNRYFKP